MSVAPSQAPDWQPLAQEEQTQTNSDPVHEDGDPTADEQASITGPARSTIENDALSASVITDACEGAHSEASVAMSLPTMDGESVASGSVAVSDLSIAASVLDRARAVLGSRSVAASSAGAVPSERYKVVLKGDASSKVEDDRSTTIGW